MQVSLEYNVLFMFYKQKKIHIDAYLTLTFDPVTFTLIELFQVKASLNSTHRFGL